MSVHFKLKKKICIYIYFINFKLQILLKTKVKSQSFSNNFYIPLYLLILSCPPISGLPSATDWWGQQSWSGCEKKIK